MEKQDPTVLKARIHKDLLRFKDHFWRGMTTFVIAGKAIERYRPDGTEPSDIQTFTRTLTPREEEYYQEVVAAFPGEKQVALIESFLLTVARIHDPDNFPKPALYDCPGAAMLAAQIEPPHQGGVS